MCPPRAARRCWSSRRTTTSGGSRGTPTGRCRSAVRVNGWQQGWVVPAGAARTVSADFGPDGTYRAGLAGGAHAAAGLPAVALWPARREGDERTSCTRAHGLGVECGGRGPSHLVVRAAGRAGLWELPSWWRYVLRSPGAEAAGAFVAMVMAGVLVAAAPPWPAGRAAVDDSLFSGSSSMAVAVCVLAPVGTRGAAELWSRVSPRRPQPHDRALHAVVARGTRRPRIRGSSGRADAGSRR